MDKPGLKMRTMPVPLPLPSQLRPSAASSGGYLFIAASDELIDEALAVKSGQKPGLKATDEFKHLSQGLPDQGNQFCFVSQRFARTLMQVQQQAMAAKAKTEPQMAQWMQSLFTRAARLCLFRRHEHAGRLSDHRQRQPELRQCRAAAGVAVAAHAFRDRHSQLRQSPDHLAENACINNLRQIDAAKQQWALEKGKQSTDMPTMEDLKPYLRSIPHCPAGGTYTIDAGRRAARVQYSRPRAALNPSRVGTYGVRKPISESACNASSPVAARNCR